MAFIDSELDFSDNIVLKTSFQLRKEAFLAEFCSPSEK